MSLVYVLKTSYVFDVSSSLRRGANVRVVYIGLFVCSLAMMVVRVCRLIEAKNNNNAKGSRFLISISFMGSAGLIRLVVHCEELVQL